MNDKKQNKKKKINWSVIQGILIILVMLWQVKLQGDFNNLEKATNLIIPDSPFRDKLLQNGQNSVVPLDIYSNIKSVIPITVELIKAERNGEEISNNYWIEYFDFSWNSSNRITVDKKGSVFFNLRPRRDGDYILYFLIYYDYDIINEDIDPKAKTLTFPFKFYVEKSG